MNFITNRHVAASITFLPGSKKGQPFIAICLNLLYFLSCKVSKVHLHIGNNGCFDFFDLPTVSLE